MINSMKRKDNLINPENAASFIPIFISSVFSILLIIFFVVPQYIKSTKVNLELIELIKKKNDLENIKSKYEITNQKFNKLNIEKEKIIELISGTSNLDTLLTKFGEIGEKYNIEFDSIIPKKIINFIEDNSKKKNTNEISKSNIDPLLVEGTKKYIIEFIFKTDFANLLSFIRELEFQDNIILLEDIQVLTNDIDTEENPIALLQVKLIMNIYGKI